MTWYEIMSFVVGVFGGTAGLVGLYKAKSEKTTIDVGNMQTMLDEAHKMYNASLTEKTKVTEEFSAYKAETMRYIAEFKERFSKLEKRLDKTETEVFSLKGAVYQGYRCKFPPKIEDCPVIKEYEKFHCNECKAKME